MSAAAAELVAEPLARLGGTVTAIDPAPGNIAAASLHAEAAGLTIDYRATTAEDLAATGATFDLITCLEVIEHVPDQKAFVATIAGLLKPGGLVVFSTLNRTPLSYALGHRRRGIRPRLGAARHPRLGILSRSAN